MIPILGYLALALSFLVAVYGLIAAIWSLLMTSKAWQQSARLALIVVFAMVSLSVLMMLVLLVNHRFDVAYVYQVASNDMPVYLRLSALWGGQSGSLLTWSWFLAGFGALFIIRKKAMPGGLLSWVLLVLLLLVGFFLALNLFMDNPFERFWHFPDGSRVMSVFQPAGAWPLRPTDGRGLNPLLRHPGMILHPPLLYLGFVGYAIPFALAIASLASGRSDQYWLQASRRWSLMAWLFLTLGLVLGMRWAYDVLGWGGYWGWDPVEVAALMPWLSGTALLHMILLQRQQDRYKRWNIILIFLTFGLVIFGAFLTRSGVLSSVHSFARSAIGPVFFVFIALVSIASLALLVYRWQSLHVVGEPAFKLSKEVLILFTNLVLLSILAVCFLGVIYPLVSELLVSTKVTVGPVWYERIIGPLLLVLLLLMGVCPLAGWVHSQWMVLRRWIILCLMLSLLIPLLAIFRQVRSILTLFALWLAAFSVLVAVLPYARSVRNRWKQKAHFFKALLDPLRRNLRLYGGHLVHVGVILISIGIIGIERMQEQTQVTLALGESTTLGGYVFIYEGLESYDSSDGRHITQAVLAVQKDGKPMGALFPARDLYYAWQQTNTRPGLESNIWMDFYAILIDWRPVTKDQATFKIFLNPLVNWLWIGTGVLSLGVFMTVWPRQKGLKVKT